MAKTPKAGLPLVDPNMTADVPRDLNALAQAVDDALSDVSGGNNQTVRQQVALLC